MMGFIIRSLDIHQGLAQFQETPGAALLDVRTPQEYAEGHIPGSWNIPLQEIEEAPFLIQDKNTPVFAYCYSGARSGQAASALQRMGYGSVVNIGGISGYRGELES